MPILDIRDFVPFSPGANNSDTTIGGIHLNLTILEDWGYQLFSNGTISNGSSCFLTDPPHAPKLLYPNGTFVNATWCYDPIRDVDTHGVLSMVFAALFGFALLLTLVNLTKHGKRYLPVEKRFYPLGRRWQWYWASILCATAFISLVTNVDVDRYYVPELPVVLNAFFWYLMQLAALACVWEAVRHWGSWMERQFIDPNPFVLRDDDKRSKTEFWLPLWFYLLWWLNFFLIIPRNWGLLELQRSPEQTAEQAEPAATDGRFKAAAFCLLACWLTIVYSLRHSIQHYRPRNRGLFNRTLGMARYTPPRFLILLFLSLAVIAYQALCAFQFEYSLIRYHGSLVATFVGGYLPSLLIVVVQAFFGFVNPNEDRELIRQRRARGDALDRELGVVKKPAWWRRLKEGPDPTSMSEILAKNTRELGGGRATGEGVDRSMVARAGAREQGDIEMGAMGPPAVAPSNASVSSSMTASRPALASPYSGRSELRRTERTMQLAAGLLFPGAEPPRDRTAELMEDGPPPAYSDTDRGRSRESGLSFPPTEGGPNRPPTGGRSNSQETSASITAPPQQIRSMLDV